MILQCLVTWLVNNLEKLLILWTIRLISQTVKIPSVETAGIFYDTPKAILGPNIVQIVDVKQRGLQITNAFYISLFIFAPVVEWQTQRT